MKSLMTFVGILAFNLSNIAMSSDFSCPVNANVSNFTCSGTVKVKTLSELNAYGNNLGVVAKKPTIAKNLQIDFNPAFTSDLVISTPCSIKVPTNIVMTSTANICLHGTKGVSIDENFKFTGKNLKLESKEEVIINKNSVIKAQDIKLLSIGSGDTSKTYIREAANIEAANLSIESFDKGFIGKNSIVKLTGALGIYSLGDDEASVREGARVEAAKIEISSTEETRIAKSTTLVASEIILNGIKCTINKTAVITADNRLGNCFLISTTNKAKFSINKNQGINPLTVIFDASSIADAKGFIWSFGDGETLNSLTPNVTHVYNRVGSFTATLKYATKDNYKGLKSAGAIQIDVKEAPISNPVVPVPPRGNLKYQTDGTFVYLRGYIRKGTHDIANAYYVIDDNQDNKIQIPNFYQNSLTNVEMSTYGRHKVTMNVIDVQGLTHSKSMNVYTNETEFDVYPYMRLDVDQSAARTIFFDLSWSFNPIAGETLKNFKIDFGDGQTAVLTDTAFITHTYAQAGTYLVRATGAVNGNEDYDEYEIEVTDENTPIMNPIAGFEYQLYDYAGNVMFTNDRSGTPNGEIISYTWDFGDGTIGYGKDASNFYAPGDYLVTLTVVDTAGLRSSQTQKITIVAEGDDIASMLDCWSDGSKHLGCEVVAFDKFNEITRVKLDWGDGTSENLTVPDFASTGFSIREHNYQNFGTYSVNLTIDTARGITKNKTFNNIITNPGPVDPTDPTDPTDPIDPNQGTLVAKMFCNNLYLQVHCFANESVSSNSEIVNYRFEFSSNVKIDSSTSSQGYSYLSAGTYRVTLVVRDRNGLTASTFRDISVSPSTPEAHLGCIASYLLVSCNGINTFDYSGKSLKYEFEMGDGTTLLSSSGFISHTYTSSGLYNVKLKVTNEFEKSGMTEQVVQVLSAPENQGPVIQINCTSDAPYTLDCNLAGSHDPDGFISSYAIQFEENYIVQSSPDFRYVYKDGGAKLLRIKIIDDMGKETLSNITYDVLYNNLPTAVFNCVSYVINKIQCESNSLPGEFRDEIVDYEWDMGDGSAKIKGLYKYFDYFYSNGGNYRVKLTVKDKFGGSDTIEKEFSVRSNMPPTASINCNKLSGSLNEAGTFNCSALYGDDGNVVEAYFLVNGLKINEGSFSYDFLNGGDSLITLFVKDDMGLVTTAEHHISITNVPTVSFNCELGTPYHISCEANELPDSLGIINYAFIIDNDEMINGKKISYDFEVSGSTSIKLFALLPDGREIISERYFDIANVYQLPKADFKSYVNKNNSVIFDATYSFVKNRQVQSFKWDFGDGVIVETDSEKVEHSFSDNGTYNISLTVKDKRGMIDVISKEVKVYIQEVDDPGNSNNATVAGIDSDGNFVRDDIQRWIAYESKDNAELGYYLKKMAITYQTQIINAENKGIVLSQESMKNNIEACVLGKLNDDEKGNYYFEMLQYLYTSTQLRSQAWTKVKISLAGSLYDISPSGQMERLLKCSGI